MPCSRFVQVAIMASVLRRSAKVLHYCLPEVTQAKNTMGNEKAGDLPDIIHAEGEFALKVGN